MSTTTTRGRSLADVRSAADNRRIVALALADLPDEALDPATLDGFEFGSKVLMAAAEAACQSETYVNVRTFAHRLHREFCSGRLTPFALGRGARLRRIPALTTRPR